MPELMYYRCPGKKLTRISAKPPDNISSEHYTGGYVFYDTKMGANVSFARHALAALVLIVAGSAMQFAGLIRSAYHD